MKLHQIPKENFLYKKGDSSRSFYFMLRGKLELLVDSSHGTVGQQQNPLEFKLSKVVDENEFFGFKQFCDEQRNEYARAVTDNVEILEIEKDAYEQIVKQTQLSVSEKKIDFLMRYVPKFRSVARKLIEEMEIFFVKEVFTQGYLI